jgi:transposase
MEKATTTTKLPSAAAAKRPQRWSARRKQELVLRLLRGEPIEAIARELGIEPYRLERWRERALTGMAAGLKERADDDWSAGASGP